MAATMRLRGLRACLEPRVHGSSISCLPRAQILTKSSAANHYRTFRPTARRQSTRITQTEELPVLMEMAGLEVKYGDRTILGGWAEHNSGQIRQGLWWKIRAGERWGLFGPNGSGKTTLLSLICSDHPQAYALPIKMFGQERLPSAGQPGMSIFDLQARIGQASPEVQAFYPEHHSLRRVLESAWADTFASKPVLTAANQHTVEQCLQWFKFELEGPETSTGLGWASQTRLRDVSFSAQRVALFLRAVIKKPDLVILDEAFSGMDTPTRQKCMDFLEHGTTGSRHEESSNQDVNMTGLEPRQALLVVSHRPEEVPAIVEQWLSLPETGSGDRPRFGRIARSEREPNETEAWWDRIWDM